MGVEVSLCRADVQGRVANAELERIGDEHGLRFHGKGFRQLDIAQAVVVQVDVCIAQPAFIAQPPLAVKTKVSAAEEIGVIARIGAGDGGNAGG